jgi:hypothetical protein
MDFLQPAKRKSGRSRAFLRFAAFGHPAQHDFRFASFLRHVNCA